jgi:PBP1b-binding outer membrane lipoprotein LpoB
MKKILLLLIATLFLASCAPKRARCYGKRCVEVHQPSENTFSSQRNS